MITKGEIELYFTAQKQAGWWFAAIGLIAVAAAIVCWQYQRNPFGKGLAAPLILFGLMQCAAGLRVYNESDALRISNVYAVDMNPQQLKTTELPRMKNIQKRFAVYRWIQAIMLMAGMLLLFFLRRTPGSFWYGFGITWCVQVVVIAVVYYFAAQRAAHYIGKLMIDGQ
ncbi:hypothetical protein [Filimonas effusa]|uniref:Uncharacterized protein n=1 Tax=Filimonas effusa TaxID=2508721 RepID=A0A4Q1D0V2_9BACT|nr:hypothetical protein [Filimonas effusa]RXK80854.1 hypothetical protein ESB13_22120 [Filimonas effusa]